MKGMLLSGVLVFLAAPVEARCVSAPEPRFSVALSDTTTIHATTTDGNCAHAYMVSGLTTLTSAAVLRMPTSGTLTQTSPFSFVYSARSGFRGQDQYTVRLCGTNGGRSGCATVIYEMTVE